MESEKSAKNNKILCHDCQKEIKLKDKKILNGFLLAFKHNGNKIEIYKCKECYAENKSLANFQPCEVYSRIVGYLRPVSQWNEGKREEYKRRKEYAPCK